MTQAVQVKIKFLHSTPSTAEQGTPSTVKYGTMTYTVKQGIGFDALQQELQQYLDQCYDGAKILSVVYK